MNDVTVSPGIRSSEFLLTVLGVVALMVMVFHGDVDGSWAASAIAVACFGYQTSRAVVKRAQVSGNAQVAHFRADLATMEASPRPARPAARPVRKRATKKV